jgi:RNA polymerase sigma-70 factor (ECF subfamily)
MRNSIPDSVATSLTLVQRLRENDRQACGLFARLYGPVIYHWSRTFGLQDADAADVAQDVVMIVLSRIDTFHRESTGQSLRRWMRTITNNQCRDLFRARRRHAVAMGGSDASARMGEIPDEDSDHEVDDSFDAEASVVHAAVEILRASFEDRTWNAFMQTAIEGRQAADVASDLGMSVASVYTAKSRVLSRMKAEFDGLL